MLCKFLGFLGLLTCPATASSFGLAGQLFQLSGTSSVNNAKLHWSLVPNAAQYQILRTSTTDGDNALLPIATVVGDSFDDYELRVNSQYNYQVTALQNGQCISTSNIVSAEPFASSASYNTYDNTQSSSLLVKPNLYADGLYYQYIYQSYPNGSMQALVQQTSTDGYTFTGTTVVLSGQTVCASANYSCHLERISFNQNPSTGDFVMWGHFENTINYDLAQVAVAYGQPGQSFVFGGTYRPLGYDSRDLTFFVDGDDGYLISATDVNTNINIYGLTSNWTAVATLVDEVLIKQYREAPAMVKSDGWYYLFTSRAAGWYPSQPEYIASQSMNGPWSSPIVVGNTATFSTQSGAVDQLASGQSAMLADRWSANWSPPAGPSRELMLPISFSSDGGYASYSFYKSVEYSDAVSTAGQGMFGVQTGKILSNYMPSSSSAGTTNISYANDAVQDYPNYYFLPTSFPFWYEIDLQGDYVISQVDLTTKMVQGSETYYQFNVTGSTDGSSFTTLVDQSDNTDVGFVASYPTSTAAYRYIRVNVESIINTHNGNSATWAAGLGEVTIYGQ